ncbi:MAG: hypothetical protein AB7O32_00930 [Vicinamibacterales bacterium]
MPVLTELVLRLPNSPGALADVYRLMAAEHVGVLALGLDAAGSLRMVVNNPTRAAGALRESHQPFTTRDVLVVSAGTGADALALALRLLAEADVNVEYAYGGTGDGRLPVVVLGVEDPVRAATVAGA